MEYIVRTTAAPGGGGGNEGELQEMSVTKYCEPKKFLSLVWDQITFIHYH